jgi:signal transduction histidine kinase
MLSRFQLLLAQPPVIYNLAEKSKPAPITPKKLDQMESDLRKIEALKSAYPDSALTICYKVLADSREMDFHDGIAVSLIWMGNIYLNEKGETENALGYYRKSEAHIQKAVNIKDKLLSDWCNDMAATFSIQGRYDSALVYYEKALSIALHSKIQDKKSLAILYSNMASIYYILEQYDDARPYLLKVEKIAVPLHLNASLFDIYNTYASIFIVKDKLDSARLYIQKMRALKIDFPGKKKGNAEYLTGMIFLKKKKYRQAAASFQTSLNLSNQNSRDIINTLSGLGLANFFRKRYAIAIHYTLQSIDLSLKSGIAGRGLLETYGNLSEYYDSSRDYQRAYYYKSLAYNLKDSLVKMENSKNLNKLENHYLAAQKNKELTDKQLQLAISEATLRKKNIWIIIIIGGAIILLTLVAWFSQKQRLQLQKIKTARQQQQVEQLKAVIEGEEKERSRIGRQLHDDIMVQLSIVKMGLEALPIAHPEIRKTDGYHNIVEQLTHTSHELRQTAHNLMPDALLEEGLISAILYFCRSAEKLTGIKFLFQHYGDLPLLTSDVGVSIYRIIQELVQNIIKHAKASDALVQLNYRNNMLSLTVEDNGIGMKENGKEENKMGLKSIRTRLKAMDGVIDIHHCTPHGTSVNIELNI